MEKHLQLLLFSANWHVWDWQQQHCFDGKEQPSGILTPLAIDKFSCFGIY